MSLFSKMNLFSSVFILPCHPNQYLTKSLGDWFLSSSVFSFYFSSLLTATVYLWMANFCFPQLTGYSHCWFCSIHESHIIKSYPLMCIHKATLNMLLQDSRSMSANVSKNVSNSRKEFKHSLLPGVLSSSPSAIFLTLQELTSFCQQTAFPLLLTVIHVCKIQTF